MTTRTRVALGLTSGVGVSIVGLMANPDSPLGKALLPGAVVAVFVVSDGVHATSFAVTALIATALIYGLVVERMLWLVGRVRR